MDTFVLSLLRVSWFYPVIRGHNQKSKATRLHIRYRVKISGAKRQQGGAGARNTGACD